MPTEKVEMKNITPSVEFPLLLSTKHTTMYLDTRAKIDLFFAFLKHILYLRGQIPEPYDNIVSQFGPTLAIGSISSTKSKNRHKVRKSLEFVNRLETLKLSLEATVGNSTQPEGEMCISKFFILFGISPRLPREMYRLDFSKALVGADKGNPYSGHGKAYQALKRRLLRVASEPLVPVSNRREEEEVGGERGEKPAQNAEEGECDRKRKRKADINRRKETKKRKRDEVKIMCENENFLNSVHIAVEFASPVLQTTFGSSFGASFARTDAFSPRFRKKNHRMMDIVVLPATSPGNNQCAVASSTTCFVQRKRLKTLRKQ